MSSLRLRSTRVVALALLAVGASYGTTTASADAHPEPAALVATTWLDRLNEVRTASGVAAVTENPAWTQGITQHLTYLVNTPPGYLTGQYANAHTENPASPYYTTEGALEGGRSDLASGTTSDLAAADGWLTAPFHAIGILRPALTQVAYARLATGEAGLDVLGGLGGPAATWPVLFPGPGSTTSLNRYGGSESPDPTETCRIAKPGTTWVGLPLIALLPSAPDASIVARLTRPDGTTVASDGNGLCLVDEHHYQSTDTTYGPTGQSILAADHAVLVIPRVVLVAGTYAVSISQPARPDISWSFTSSPAGPITPVAQPPQATVTSTRCSFTRVPSGRATIRVTNPLDGAGKSAYTVATFGRSLLTGNVPDGSTSGTLGFTDLPDGQGTMSVTGSDGTSGSFVYTVAACATWKGVDADFRPPEETPPQGPIVLRNLKNAGKVRFVVRATGSGKHVFTVPGGRVATVRVPLQRDSRTVVRVLVAGHEVARHRYRL